MSILLAKHINKVLSGSAVIKKAVGDRIYRNGIDTDVPFPFVVYTYRVSQGESTKDGDGADVCQVDVMVFSRDGKQEMELSDAVRSSVAHSAADYKTFEVADIDFIGYESELDDGVYIGQLKFNAKTY